MTDLIQVLTTHLRAAGYSETTIADRARLLGHADRTLPYGLDEANADEIAEYLGSPGWSTWTRSTYWAHLYAYYSWAVQRGELTMNPMDHLKRPPAGDNVPDPVTDEELAFEIGRASCRE